jgi:very-short-patch-repair endonuclease
MGRPKGSKNGVVRTVACVCEVCGGAFEVEPCRAGSARFCSMECKNAAHSHFLFRQTERRCEYCDAAFMRRPASARRYCSQVCAVRHLRANRIGLRPAAATSTASCPICETVFTARASLHQVYCSRPCANRAMERRAVFICEVCRKASIQRLKFIRYGRRFCSWNCRNVGNDRTNTIIERLMGRALRQAGIEAVQSHPFGPYSLDFAVLAGRVCVECDGDYWHSLPERIALDAKRDRYLAKRGWTVLRFKEHRIHTDIAGCIAEVHAALTCVSESTG